MRLKNYDIHCYRGESFTLDFDVVNDDGSPYIVSNQMKDAHILLNISSTKYQQDDNIAERYWINLNEEPNKLPKFYTTIPLKLTSFDTIYKEEYPDHTADDAVYYVENDDGSKTYKYYDANSGEYKDYSFRVIIPFRTSNTIKWTEQRYYYSILLVDRKSAYEDSIVLLEPHDLFVQSEV